MLNSLKNMIVVPVIALLLLMIAFIVICWVAISINSHTDDATAERM